MKKRILYTCLVVGLGLNLLLGTQIYLRSAQAAEKDDIYHNLELFTRVLERVRAEYVDGDKLSYQDLVHGALKGMLGSLDPHSEFMEPVKYEELSKDTKGEFGGVGIVIGLRDRTLTVIEPMEDTPAFKAGVLPGDKIVKIDGKSTDNFTTEDAVKILRGEPGSEVKITISRGAETKEVVLERDIIKVHKVKDINGKREFPLGEDKVGYVRLLQFDEQTSFDLEDALKKLEGQGMKSLVLDLRGNPGGLLDQAVKVCEKFLPRGKLIVSTEGGNPADNSTYKSSGRNARTETPIAILVNGGSASASEIVAGCLQDLNRAIIVGEQTFGKGSVQKIIPLPDGAALRLTTSKYYTPSHKVIHEKGITPNIVVKMTEEEEQALYLRRLPGGVEDIDQLLTNMDAAKRERLKQLVHTVRDTQMERAVDVLKGIALYTDRQEASAKPASRN